MVGNPDIILGCVGSSVGKSASILDRRGDTDVPRQRNDAPGEKPVRDIGGQVGVLVLADDRCREGAEVTGEIVQVAAGAAAHVGEEDLALLGEPEAGCRLELAVSRSAGAFQEVEASVVSGRIGGDWIQDREAVRVVLQIPDPKAQRVGHRLLELDGRPALEVWRETIGIEADDVFKQEHIAALPMGITRYPSITASRARMGAVSVTMTWAPMP